MPTAASQTGIRSKQVVRLDFGPGEIKGVQFGDDDVFLVLLVTKGKPFLAEHDAV